MPRYLLFIAASLCAVGAAQAADNAPTKRIEDIDPDLLPPQIEVRGASKQVYADGYKIVGPNSAREAYVRRVVSEVPEALRLIDKSRKWQSLGGALIVSGLGVTGASLAASNLGVGGGTRPTAAGVLAMGTGVVLISFAPSSKKACALYNDWAFEEGIPPWP